MIAMDNGFELISDDNVIKEQDVPKTSKTAVWPLGTQPNPDGSFSKYTLPGNRFLAIPSLDENFRETFLLVIKNIWLFTTKIPVESLRFAPKRFTCWASSKRPEFLVPQGPKRPAFKPVIRINSPIFLKREKNYGSGS